MSNTSEESILTELQTQLQANRLCGQIEEAIFDPKISSDYVIQAINTLVNSESNWIDSKHRDLFVQNITYSLKRWLSSQEPSQGKEILKAVKMLAKLAFLTAYPAAVSIDNKNPALFIIALVVLSVILMGMERIKEKEDRKQEQKLLNIYSKLLEMYPALRVVDEDSGNEASSALNQSEL